MPTYVTHEGDKTTWTAEGGIINTELTKILDSLTSKDSLAWLSAILFAVIIFLCLIVGPVHEFCQTRWPPPQKTTELEGYRAKILVAQAGALLAITLVMRIITGILFICPAKEQTRRALLDLIADKPSYWYALKEKDPFRYWHVRRILGDEMTWLHP